MTSKQKVAYVLNEWMIAWLLFYAMVMFVALGIAGENARTATDYFTSATILMMVTAIMLGPFALVKWLTIRRSKRRTLESVLSSATTAGY